MFTYKATQFDIFGFVLVLLGSASSGLRWTCAQLLLQKSKLGLRNPVDMVYHVQPWMILAIFPFAVAIEGILTMIIKCYVTLICIYISSMYFLSL